MIRKLLFLALLAPLVGCDWSQKPPPPPPPVRHEPPRHVDRGPDWLDPNPECAGSLRRGEWLVCDNKHLNWLHRTLASQWAAERQGADRQHLFIQRQQLQALISERSACETVECVATAYRRFLAAPAKPVSTPTPAKPRPRKPVRHEPRGPSWNWRDNAPSCSARIGWSAAATLARQCSIVNPGEGRECSPTRSCSALRTMVLEGCWDMDRKPGFCGRDGRRGRD